MSSIPGTNVAAPVVPFTTDDTYPTHVDKYGMGGWRGVANAAELDAIPQNRRSDGMAVMVKDSGLVYVYRATSPTTGSFVVFTNFNNFLSTLVFSTWAELSGFIAANPGLAITDGAAARVLNDAGTHTDPVTGTAGVANQGVYRFHQAAPVGWQRIANLEAADASIYADQAQAAAATATTKATEVSAALGPIQLAQAGISENFAVTPPKNLYDPALAQDGQLYNYPNGTLGAFANSMVTGRIPVPSAGTWTLWQKSPEAGFFPYIYAWDSGGNFLGMNATPSGSSPPIVAGLTVTSQDAGGTEGFRRLVVAVPAGVAFIGTMALYGYAAHNTTDFNRIRTSIQFEAGASATAFETYRTTSRYDLKDASVPATVERTSRTNPIVEAFVVEPKRNLYDLSQAVDAQVTGFSTGMGSAFANGMHLGSIPVEEGKTYVIWMSDPLGFAPGGNKPLYCYGASGNFLGLDAAIGASPAAPNPPTSVVWTGVTQVKFTIPVGSGIRRVGVTSTYSVHTTQDFERVRASIQGEEGSVPTVYQPYSPNGYARLPASRVGSSSTPIVVPPLRVSRRGTVIYIRSEWNSTLDLIQKINLSNASAAAAFTGNDIVNHQGARLCLRSTADAVAAWDNGTTIQTSGDDAAPLNYFNTYIGSNHGAFIVREITANAHGKLTVDVGSEYTDGAGVKWYIMRVKDVNTLWLVSANQGVYPAWSFSGTVTGNLTHSANGTNTGTITPIGNVGTQLWPCVRQIDAPDVYMDGVTKITADGDFFCHTLDVAERYAIMNPAAVLNFVKAAVGGATQPSFVASGIADPDVDRSLMYRYAENGSCAIYDAPLPLNPLTFNSGGYFGGTQAGPLTFTGKQLWQYIPRVLPKVGTVKTWDFKAMEDISGTFEELHMLPADWEDADRPPDRMAQLVKASGGAFEYGLMVGYSPARGIGVAAVRKTLLNDALFVSAARKQYPKAVSGGTIAAGVFYEMVAFRIYLNPGDNPQATSVGWFRDGPRGGDVIVFADFHQAVSHLPLKLPPYLAGMNWQVVDKSASVTMDGQGVMSRAGPRVSCSGSQGYVVLRLKANA